MKKMISKIMLAVLMVGSMPIHAGLGDSIGNNAKWIALGITLLSGLFVYATYGEVSRECAKRIESRKTDLESLKKNRTKGNMEERNSLKQEIKVLKAEQASMPYVVSLAPFSFGLMAYGLAKVCGFFGSSK